MFIFTNIIIIVNQDKVIFLHFVIQLIGKVKINSNIHKIIH